MDDRRHPVSFAHLFCSQEEDEEEEEEKAPEADNGYLLLPRATFIPFLRKIFRRGKDRESRLSSNDTEYAFRRTKKFLKILKNNVMGKGSIASVGMFVFAVLYLFQSEVTIRVAKTLQKRIKKLNARLESGDADVDDKDLKLLQGWRWRVLLW